MSEDSLIIIDTYLGHVRENLPESIANEVITELRGYMVEMAEELGNGSVTNSSAKKVVAQFGAPSEVAREYALSISDSTDDAIEVHHSQQQLVEDMRRQKRELFPASYLSTFVKFIIVAALWLAISWTVITPFAYWWLSSVAILAPVIQLGVTATACAVILLLSRKRGLRLRSARFTDWSDLQKLVTFPENIALEIYGTKVLVDIGLTILTIFAFVALGAYASPFFMLFFAAPVVVFSILHLVYTIRRFGNSDPVSFVKREYLVNILLLLSLNFVIAWGTYPWEAPVVNPFLLWYALAYSTLILYQLITRAQDLWWEDARTSEDYSVGTPSLSPEENRKVLSKIKRTALRTAGGISATFISILLAGFLIPVFANSEISGFLWYTHWSFMAVMAGFSALVSVGLATTYFGVRYILVRSRGRIEVFGKRTRAEAAIDSIITVAGFLLMMLGWPYLTGRMGMDALGLISGASPQFRFVLAIAILTWPMFLLIAIIARIAADFGGLKQRDSDFALEAMDFSGNLFAIQMALLIGIYLSLLSVLDPFQPILNEVFVILSFSYVAMILFAFQKSTSNAKLKRRRA